MFIDKYRAVLLRIYKWLPIKMRYYISYLLNKKYIVGIVAFVLDGHKLLLVKHSYQYHWSLPGGFIKPGEDFHKSIKREIKEEAGLNIREEKVLKIYSEKNKPTVNVLIECKVLSGKLEIDNVEVENAKFFSLKKLPNNILDIHKPLIKKYIAGY